MVWEAIYTIYVILITFLQHDIAGMINIYF